mmetsp:Transcript_288/g.609  ORF Transcript_288/g.609 Transcript_288/m.609 type:complete len:400 (-) Transcript_288:484-1683(-)
MSNVQEKVEDQSMIGYLCPLCCEEESPTSPSVLLSQCRHKSCNACLIKWIQKEESSGQTMSPTCPFCRSEISVEDTIKILGRPFVPREEYSDTNTNNSTSGEGEIDELSLQWLNENTMLCRGCGSHVEKADGCDVIDCLCGWRFCHGCGSPGGRCECECNPDYVYMGYDYISNHAPMRDARGRIDIEKCIERSNIRRERQYVRNGERSEEDLRWTWSAKNASLSTPNGRWLFSPANSAGSIKMITEKLSFDKRGRLRNVLRHEEKLRWLYSANDASACTANGRWLFCSAKNRGSIKMLTQQIKQDSINKKRASIRSKRNCGIRPKWNLDLSCMFPMQLMNAEINVQRREQAKHRTRRREIREANRKDEAIRWMHSHGNAVSDWTGNGIWLFSCEEDDGY